eukprot:Skav235021  [mRNA]  locus=scaffold276:351580:351801:- [translate_table: standard]
MARVETRSSAANSATVSSAPWHRSKMQSWRDWSMPLLSFACPKCLEHVSLAAISASPVQGVLSKLMGAVCVSK